MPQKTLGGEIRRLRTVADKTLRGFAAELDISAAHLSDIEHDRRRPSVDLLERIVTRLAGVGAVLAELRALGTSIDPETREWVSSTQNVGEMLRQLRDSGISPQQIIDHIEREKRKGRKD